MEAAFQREERGNCSPQLHLHASAVHVCVPRKVCPHACAWLYMCVHTNLNKERLFGNQSFLVVGLPWGTEDDNVKELGA